MKYKKLLVIYVLVSITVLSIIVNAADIMKLEDIETGMVGTARTVFQGYKVEEFPVEIIDIVDQGLDKKLILFKAGGEKIEEIGGIAAGMSGSPVYIEGKLIGAIAYGWSFSDHRYGMITPIEDMLELLDENIDTDNYSRANTNIQLKTPLFISGMEGRSFARIKSKFEDMGFQVLQSGGIGSIPSSGELLEEGSAVGLQLARGDINIASIGTLTYKENEEFIAFGHPFTNRGNVDFLLSRAYINTIIPSIDRPFKLGAVTDELIGSVTVDRGSGIAGKLNKYPKIIPLSIKVSDLDRNKRNTVNVQLVKDEDLLTSLITNISLQAVDSVLDRIGKGTANVNLKITGKDLPGLGIERSNVFYSRSDIAAVALYEVYELFNIINGNPYQKVNLIDVKLDIEIKEVDNVALIQEAKVLNEKIKPGDTLEIEVTLLPYRSQPIVKKVSLKLPEEIEPGVASLVIEGGLTGTSYQSIPEEEISGVNHAIIDGYKDLASIIDDYLARPKNNELFLQLYPPYSESSGDTESAKDEEADTDNEQGDVGREDMMDEESNMSETEIKNKHSINSDDEVNLENENQIRAIYPTDYVLEGSLFIDINIEGEVDRIDYVSSKN